MLKKASIFPGLLILYGLVSIVSAFKVLITHYQFGIGGWDGPGYYMPLAERMAFGDEIYFDIHSSYTPLALYYLSWFQTIFGTIIEDRICIHYLALISVHLISSALLIYLLWKLKVHASLIVLAVGFFLQMLVAHMGSHIFLESFMIPFILFFYGHSC